MLHRCASVREANALRRLAREAWRLPGGWMHRSILGLTAGRLPALIGATRSAYVQLYRDIYLLDTSDEDVTTDQ